MVAFDRQSNFNFGSSENPTLRDKKNRAEVDLLVSWNFFPLFICHLADIWTVLSVWPSGRPSVRHTLFAPFPSSDFRETCREYWYWVTERPGTKLKVMRPRSRSQRSNNRSKLGIFTHFRELVLGLSSDFHQNGWTEAKWSYKKT